MKFIIPILILLVFTPFHLLAQANSDTINRIIVLPDVEINSSSSQLVVCSGIEKNNICHVSGPGGGYAVRFRQPVAGYHELQKIRLQLHQPKNTKEGQIRIRVASVNTNGEPGNDNMLPQEVILTTKMLCESKRNLTVMWPESHVVSPEKGFFIVVEGIGKSSNEYISSVAAPNDKGISQYVLSGTINGSTFTRQVPITYFPTLKGINSSNDNDIESWYKDTVTKGWKRSKKGASVVYIEALFE